MSARTKYSPAVHAKIVEALELGANPTTAARAAGICDDSLRTYRQKYPDLERDVAAAQARFELTHLRRIEAHADNGSLAASQWILERTRPDSYGRSSAAKVELTGKDGGPISVADATARIAAKFDAMSTHELLALAERDDRGEA